MKKLFLIVAILLLTSINLISQNDYHQDRILVKLKNNVELKNVKRDIKKMSMESTGHKNIDLLNELYPENQTQR